MAVAVVMRVCISWCIASLLTKLPNIAIIGLGGHFSARVVLLVLAAKMNRERCCAHRVQVLHAIAVVKHVVVSNLCFSY